MGGSICKNFLSNYTALETLKSMCTDSDMIHAIHLSSAPFLFFFIIGIPAFTFFCHLRFIYIGIRICIGVQSIAADRGTRAR